jgi:hypothetical protein
MECAFTVRALKDGDASVEAAARAFAGNPLYERVFLHGALEVKALRERSDLQLALHGERAVGLVAQIEGLFPYRLVALDAMLPGVTALLLRGVSRPFVCTVPARLAREVERAGGRAIRRELQMVRFARDPEPEVNLDGCPAEVERLQNASEVARFCGPGFSPLELTLAPFFGIRDAYGELAAVAGARFLSPRVALLAHLETRDDCRRRGFARSLARVLLRALETDRRHALVQLKDGEQPAARLFAELGFRGTHEFRVFAF